MLSIIDTPFCMRRNNGDCVSHAKKCTFFGINTVHLIVESCSHSARKHAVKHLNFAFGSSWQTELFNLKLTLNSLSRVSNSSNSA